MLNSNKLRKERKEGLFNNHLCTCSFCEMRQDEQPKMPFILTRIGLILTIVILSILITVFFQSCSYASPMPLTDQTAILGVIGEAESESMVGKLALAEAIRKRGTLKGVFGANSVVVINGVYYKKVSLKSKYYKRTGKRLRPISAIQVELAKSAWWDSRYTNYSHGATGWGNTEDVVKFKQEGWFNSCQITARIGNHTFYKCGD